MSLSTEHPATQRTKVRSEGGRRRPPHAVGPCSITLKSKSSSYEKRRVVRWLVGCWLGSWFSGWWVVDERVVDGAWRFACVAQVR